MLYQLNIGILYPMSVKTVFFSGKMKGNGVVNFDGKASKYWIQSEYARHENVKVAKTSVSIVPSQVYPSDGGGDGGGGGGGDEAKNRPAFNRRSNPKARGNHIHRDLKISSNAMRHKMFSSGQPFQTSHMFTKDSDLIPYQIANATSLLRGYLLTDPALKRKSPVMMSDAIQEEGDLLKMEIASSSGPRTGTSLYMVDRIGEVGYKFEASIDIGELRFVSCDPLFDRQAFNSDSFEDYRRVLGKNLGFDASSLEIKHYVKKHSEIPVAERGILLPPEVVKNLVITAISNMLQIEFRKASGYARVTELKIYLANEDQLFIDLDTKSTGKPVINQNSLAEFIKKELADFDPYCGYREATDIEIRGNGVATKLYREFQVENEKKKEEKKKEIASKKTTKKTSKAPKSKN